jgi:hypothetical protein
LGGNPDDPHSDPQDRSWYGPHDRLFRQEESEAIVFRQPPPYGTFSSLAPRSISDNDRMLTRLYVVIVWCWGWDGAGDLDGPDVEPIWELMVRFPFHSATPLFSTPTSDMLTFITCFPAQLHDGYDSRSSRSFVHGAIDWSVGGGNHLSASHFVRYYTPCNFVSILSSYVLGSFVAAQELQIDARVSRVLSLLSASNEMLSFSRELTSRSLIAEGIYI